MLRLLRRLLTAVSAPCLLVVLACWARAQWRQHVIVYITAADEPPALRQTTTAIYGLRDAVEIERHTVRWDLFDVPAAKEFRRLILGECGTLNDTSPADSLPASTPGLIALGFRWYANPRSGESPFAPSPGARPQGWRNGGTRDIQLAIPWWFLALVFAMLPALSLRPYLRVIRHRPGTCPQCGYDLRASPTRCPECGRPTQNPANGLPSHS